MLLWLKQPVITSDGLLHTFTIKIMIKIKSGNSYRYVCIVTVCEQL